MIGKQKAIKLHSQVGANLNVTIQILFPRASLYEDQDLRAIEMAVVPFPSSAAGICGVNSR